MTARRWAIAGLIIILAIIIGVLARWNLSGHEDVASAPQSPAATTSDAPTAAAPETAAEQPVASQATDAPNMAAAMPEDPAAPAASLPAFDVVRVEPGGEAVIAGRAAPGAAIELLANGSVIDRTNANEAGEFVMMPAPLPPGSHELVLKAGEAGSRQAVSVSVPEPGKDGEVLVVVGEPGKASQVVQAGAPDSPAAGALSAVPGYVVPAAPQDTALRVGAVEAGGGRLFVQGSGAPGASAIIYLNEAPLAEAKIGPDGRWSLTIGKGLVAGDYRIRIDQTDADGKVVARAEVPFTAEGPALADATGAEPAVTDAGGADAHAQAEAASASAESTSTAAAESTTPSDVAAEAPAEAAAAPSQATAPAETATETSAPASASGPAGAESAAVPSDTAVSAPAPAAEAPAAEVQTATPAQAAPDANPVVSEMRTVTIRRGDNLWRISRKIYGEGIRYSTIYEANTDQIRDPNRIYPGQVFVMPGG